MYHALAAFSSTTTTTTYTFHLKVPYLVVDGRWEALPSKAEPDMDANSGIGLGQGCLLWAEGLQELGGVPLHLEADEVLVVGEDTHTHMTTPGTLDGPAPSYSRARWMGRWVGEGSWRRRSTLLSPSRSCYLVASCCWSCSRARSALLDPISK